MLPPCLRNNRVSSGKITVQADPLTSCFLYMRRYVPSEDEVNGRLSTGLVFLKSLAHSNVTQTSLQRVQSKLYNRCFPG